MMFHAALCWPERHDKTLWPLAMSYAVNIHNNTPKRIERQSPLEMWTSAKSTHTHLTNSRVWGCPTYVLDPRLQDGFKIPRWEPRSR